MCLIISPVRQLSSSFYLLFISLVSLFLHIFCQHAWPCFISSLLVAVGSSLLFDICLRLMDEKVISLFFAHSYQMEDCVHYRDTSDTSDSKQQINARTHTKRKCSPVTAIKCWPTADTLNQINNTLIY